MARWGGTILRGLALAALIVALAGPQWPSRAAPLPTLGISIEILVDVSGSMAERDAGSPGQPLSRLAAVKRAARTFVAGGAGEGGAYLPDRKSDLIGLTVFAALPEDRCPLTLDHRALLDALAAEQPRVIPTEQTTNIGDAIAWALERLRHAPTQRRIVVLMTDGEHNQPPPALTPSQGAQIAAAIKIPIYTINVAPIARGATAPEGQRAAETLRYVAESTQGRYTHAPDLKGLAEAFQSIDQSERIERSGPRAYADLFPWFGAASFVIWLGLLALENSLWRQVP
jgi:Ca-activated chloride channel family protein